MTNAQHRLAIGALCCLVAICPIVLLYVSHGFYNLIGNRYPSRFLGVMLFFFGLTSFAWVAIAEKEKKRKRALQIATLWLCTIVSCIGFDVLYHLTDDRIPPTGWHIIDATFKTRYKPRLQWEGWFLGDQTRWDTREKRYVHFRMDANGFRNETTPQTAKIVCIGNSFTETGVSGTETYPAILSQLTGETVANLGVGTYSAQQELEVLRQFVLPLTPKILIWQIFEGNDLREALEYANWQKGKTVSRSTLNKVHLRLKFAMRGMMNRSIVVKTLRRLVMPSRMQFSYQPSGDSTQVAQHQGWGFLKAALTEGIQLAEANDIQTILLFFPCKASLYHPEAQRPCMVDLLQQFADEQKIDFIDMWSIYRKKYVQDGEIYYWYNDSHISDVGCHLAAQILAREIVGN